MKNLFIILSIMCLVMVGAGNVFADADAEAKAKAGAELTQIDNSVTNSKNYNRQFVNAGITPIPGTNGFFTAPTPDSSFRMAKELIYYLTGDPEAISVRLTEGALENLAKGGDVDDNLQIVRADVATAKPDENGDRWLTISIIAPVVKDGKMVGVRKENLMVGAFADGEADDRETNSFMVIGKCGLKALRAGFDHMQIVSEGAHRAVEASGFGIGTYTVGGKISDSGKSSGLVGGGLGYAWNDTSTEDRPWIQANVGSLIEK